MTFDVESSAYTYVTYSWQRHAEVFAVCRHCSRPTIFSVSQANIDLDSWFRSHKPEQYTGALNDIVKVDGYVSLKDESTEPPPEFIPPEVEKAFNEAATCRATKCWNAAAAMFRLCIDLASKSLLPSEDSGGPTGKIRRDLGLRLPWLFANGLLPEELRELSNCIREDGNDGAHAGNITQDDVEDLLDFTHALLERIYTEPQRIKMAKERRTQRRKQ